MPFCANCGLNVNDSDRFCQQCGTPRASTQSVPPPPPPPQYVYRQQEPPPQYAYSTPQPGVAPLANPPQVVAILPGAKMMTPLGSSDPYTIVFTPDRAIFAKLTGEILKDEIEKAQAQSKAQGKGWLGRANDRMRAPGNAHKRYFEMTPDRMLAETPGNFALDHAGVAFVGVKVVYEYSNQDAPAEPFTEIEFATNAGILKFRLRQPVKEVAQTLGNFYAGRIRG